MRDDLSLLKIEKNLVSVVEGKSNFNIVSREKRLINSSYNSNRTNFLKVF